MHEANQPRYYISCLHNDINLSIILFCTKLIMEWVLSFGDFYNFGEVGVATETTSYHASMHLDRLSYITGSKCRSSTRRSYSCSWSRTNQTGIAAPSCTPCNSKHCVRACMQLVLIINSAYLSGHGKLTLGWCRCRPPLQQRKA